jgi:hypothetical protein
MEKINNNKIVIACFPRTMEKALEVVRNLFK